ncbi:hypothetical protein LUZ60_007588 [Juncus effusus]|nr:hypothetical protein LUZ60_007588 [Juncus effusus]
MLLRNISNPSSQKRHASLLPFFTLRSFHSKPNPNPNLLTNSDDPVETLSSLWVRSFSLPPLSPFANLTGFLKSHSLWILAYQRSTAHHTGTFPSRTAINNNSSQLQALLSLKNLALSSPSSFPWGASSNLVLRSPLDKPSTVRIGKRKFEKLLEGAAPPFQDRVVQEVLLMVLEPVLERRFSNKSHAYRPGRGPHTAIRTVRSNFAGYLWFVKADLSEVSARLEPDVILGFLGKAVLDRNVNRLVKSSLRRPVRLGSVRNEEREVDGFMKKRIKRKVLRESRKKKVLNENEPKPDPYWLRLFYNFAPNEAKNVPDFVHCGILSPLLLNLCFSELDYWMEEKIEKYFNPSKLDSIWKDKNDDCHNPSWPEFAPAGTTGMEKTRKMDYIRYGSHFLIGIRGPREDAVQIRRDLIEFCETKFGTKLENSKIEIEHITRGIEFLDHTISRRVIYPTLRYTGTGGKIVTKKGIGTILSVNASLTKCINNFRNFGLIKGDKDPEPLPCLPMLYSSQAHTNSQMNKFLETICDWYKYSDNRKKIVGFCAYIIRSSLAKLYAARYRLKSRAKVYKIARRDLGRQIKERTKNSDPEYSDLLRMGAVDFIEGVQFANMASIPKCDYTPFKRNWVPKFELVINEYVKLKDPKFFCELYKVVKRRELGSPQDFVSGVVWDFKVLGVWSRKLQDKYEKDVLLLDK